MTGLLIVLLVMAVTYGVLMTWRTCSQRRCASNLIEQGKEWRNKYYNVIKGHEAMIEQLKKQLEATVDMTMRQAETAQSLTDDNDRLFDENQKLKNDAQAMEEKLQMAWAESRSLASQRNEANETIYEIRKILG